MQRKRFAIFDLDGTLLDTLDDLTAAVNHALATVGLPRRRRSEVRAFLGNGIRRLMYAAVGPDCPEDVVQCAFEAFRVYYMAHCAECTRPFAGVDSLLAALRREGVATAIVSNKADAVVQLLRRRFFADMVELAVGESVAVRRKPHPDAILKALYDLGGHPAEAVYVGDSEVDIEAARQAEIDCITVLWGFRDEDFLRRAGAGILVRRPEEIFTIVTGREW